MRRSRRCADYLNRLSAELLAHLGSGLGSLRDWMNILNTLPTPSPPYEYLYHNCTNKQTNRPISLFVYQIIRGLFVCLSGSKQTMFVKLLVYWTPCMFLVAVPVFDQRCLESLVGDQAGGWFKPSFMYLEPLP